jgi:FHS family L-fucose permease-like MFS transporter
VRLGALSMLLCFFAMGFADMVGVLIAFAQKEYSLSGPLLTLTASSGLIAFAVVAVPGGVLVARCGTRWGLLLALGVTLAGQVGLAAWRGRALAFAVSVAVLAIGTALLHVAGFASMVVLSSPGRLARGLVLAQFTKGLGSIAGSATAIGLAASGFAWTSAFWVYGLVLVLAWTAVASTGTEARGSIGGERAAQFGGALALLRQPRVAATTLGIFLYYGIEVGLGCWTGTYLRARFALDVGRLAVAGMTFFFLALMAGRVLGVVALHLAPGRRLLPLAAWVGLLGLAGLLVPDGRIAVVSIFVAGLGLGNVFPLLLAALLGSQPARQAEISGLACAAIAGGAVLPPLMGMLAERSAVSVMVVPLVAMVYVTALAMRSSGQAQAVGT